MKLHWTRHAAERQKQWENKLRITREEVEAVLAHPEQVVPGDGDVLVAQARKGVGLIRVPFIRSEDKCMILTVYWTTRVEKYWKGTPDANQL